MEFPFFFEQGTDETFGSHIWSLEEYYYLSILII